jgi:hypothetical protein
VSSADLQVMQTWIVVFSAMPARLPARATGCGSPARGRAPSDEENPRAGG